MPLHRLLIVMFALSETSEDHIMLRTLPHGARELADYDNHGSALTEPEIRGRGSGRVAD